MQKRTRRILLGITLIVVILIACNAQNAELAERAASLSAAATEDADWQELKIPLELLSEEPTFLDYSGGTVPMQLIAVASGEDVRLAWNTCQSCGGSPYAWFEYIGNGELQCQNCGLTFPLSTVGTTAASGCNPVPITDYTVQNGKIVIPASAFERESVRFETWKVFDE